jgi:hypothetical protein
MIIKDSKLPQNIPIAKKHSKYVALKYTNIVHSKALQNSPTWDFGMQLCHPATLAKTLKYI